MLDVIFNCFANNWMTSLLSRIYSFVWNSFDLIWKYRKQILCNVNFVIQLSRVENFVLRGKFKDLQISKFLCILHLHIYDILPSTPMHHKFFIKLFPSINHHCILFLFLLLIHCLPMHPYSSLVMLHPSSVSFLPRS